MTARTLYRSHTPPILLVRGIPDTGLASLRPLLPVAGSYVLSFVYLVIYWNDHHHPMHLTHTVTGAILWANAHLLFWLSLVPFVTAWMGANLFVRAPMAAYGTVLFMSGVWLSPDRRIERLVAEGTRAPRQPPNVAGPVAARRNGLLLRA